MSIGVIYETITFSATTSGIQRLSDWVEDVIAAGLTPASHPKPEEADYGLRNMLDACLAGDGPPLPAWAPPWYRPRAPARIRLRTWRRASTSPSWPSRRSGFDDGCPTGPCSHRPRVSGASRPLACDAGLHPRASSLIGHGRDRQRIDTIQPRR